MTLLMIIALLIQIETGGEADPANAKYDGGASVGWLQIKPIMVAEANRILGREEFTLKDRRNKIQSIRLATAVLSYRVKRYRHRYRRKPSAFCLMCSWQSGSIFKVATRDYEQKVNIVLDSLSPCNRRSRVQSIAQLVIKGG
jgi:hypothetical protein